MFAATRLRTLGRTRRTACAAVLAVGTVVTAAAAAPYALSGYVAPHGIRTHWISVGSDDNYLVVNGTAGRDIDCWVYDDGGTLVDSDTRPASDCVLETPGVGSHRLVIENLDERGSSYTVWRSR